jgi:hypothetical protein
MGNSVGSGSNFLWVIVWRVMVICYSYCVASCGNLWVIV